MAGTQKSSRKEVRRPVWAEVSLGALVQNLEAIRKYVNPPHEKRKPARKILSIVKGNGYGHGGPEVARRWRKPGRTGLALHARTRESRSARTASASRSWC